MHADDLCIGHVKLELTLNITVCATVAVVRAPHGTTTASLHITGYGIASFPGPFEGKEKGPGTHCLRMRVIFLTFRGIRILS